MNSKKYIYLESLRLFSPFAALVHAQPINSTFYDFSRFFNKLLQYIIINLLNCSLFCFVFVLFVVNFVSEDMIRWLRLLLENNNLELAFLFYASLSLFLNHSVFVPIVLSSLFSHRIRAVYTLYTRKNWTNDKVLKSPNDVYFYIFIRFAVISLWTMLRNQTFLVRLGNISTRIVYFVNLFRKQKQSKIFIII